GVTLTSGDSCTVEVTFAPTGSGAKTGALTVDTSAGRKSVALSGAGVTPAPRDGAGQQPPVVNHTVIQLVPGSGSAAGSAPAAPAQAVSPASARALTVAGLGVAPRISVTRLRAHGVRADMRVAPGTNVVRIAI